MGGDAPGDARLVAAGSVKDFNPFENGPFSIGQLVFATEGENGEDVFADVSLFGNLGLARSFGGDAEATAGDDTIVSSHFVLAGAGDDAVTAAEGSPGGYGGAGDVTILGTERGQTLAGGAGADVIVAVGEAGGPATTVFSDDDDAVTVRGDTVIVRGGGTIFVEDAADRAPAMLSYENGSAVPNPPFDEAIAITFDLADGVEGPVTLVTVAPTEANGFASFEYQLPDGTAVLQVATFGG